MSQLAPLVANDVALLLVESGQVFARALDETAIYRILEKQVQQAMSCQGLLVSSFDPKNSLIRCVYALIDGERPDPSGFPPIPLSTTPGQGMQSEVIRTGKGRIFGDVRERVEEAKGTYYDVDAEGKTKKLPKGSESPTSSAVMVPINLDDEVVGVIQVMSAEPGAYGDAHLLYLQGVASQMAAAQKNAELFQMMQQEIAERTRIEATLREREEEVNRLNADLERRVTERTQELQQAIADMDSFCYSISHDFRQPLRGICGSAAMLMDDHKDELTGDSLDLLTSLYYASKRMSGLIDDLLNFSRLSRSQMRSFQVDLTTLAHSVTRKRTQETSSVTVTVQPELTAFGDRDLLEIALDSLIGNAIKFSIPNGSPQILVGKDGERFFVRDNGIGFEQQYMDKMFRPFERLHRDQDFPGTGIGLANAKRVIERHGGSIWAEGTPGKGATFYFTLPTR